MLLLWYGSMSRHSHIAPETPREQQTLHLPEEKLKSLRPWAIEGTGLTASARVKDSEGRIALVRNSWSDGWFVPGGAVEPGETPQEAARREIHEETGLNATVKEPLVVLEQTYRSENADNDWFSALFIVYTASAEGDIPPVSQLGKTDTEIEAAQWFKSLPDDFHDGTLLRPYL